MNNLRKKDAPFDLMELLYKEICQLQKEHDGLLEQESLSADVQKLKLKLDECRNNSKEALAYLEEHGMACLEDIKCRLKVALEDEAKIIEESPSVAENSSGIDVHAAHQAVSIACDAMDKLKPAIHNKVGKK